MHRPLLPPQIPLHQKRPGGGHPVPQPPEDRRHHRRFKQPRFVLQESFDDGRIVAQGEEPFGITADQRQRVAPGVSFFPVPPARRRLTMRQMLPK